MHASSKGTFRDCTSTVMDVSRHSARVAIGEYQSVGSYSGGITPGSRTYFIGEQKANIVHCNFSQGANPLESALPGGLIPATELWLDGLRAEGKDGA
jgi:hypothetical protein